VANGADYRVAICVITFRRQKGLRRLLEALSGLQLPRHTPIIEVLVVDNDAERSAEEVCKTLAGGYRWPMHYTVQPQRGIPLARNRAVTCVIDRTDLIAFIDDDATPQPNWLDELLEVKHQFAADIVTGPLTRRFGSDAPAWLKRGRWLEPQRHPTGQRLDHAFTCNVLIDVAVFRQMETWFDPRIGLGGGSDIDFFRKAARAGHTIVWADRAMIEEWTAASRVTAKGVLHRGYSVANAAALLDIQLGHGVGTRLVLALRATLLAFRGLATLPLVLTHGKGGLVRAALQLARAAGTVAGIAGRRAAYYRTPHGSL
jgi:succinoglycan biosynthesis protein ExoM